MRLVYGAQYIRLMGLKWLLIPTTPLLLGFETCNLDKMVSKSKSRPQPLSSLIFGAHYSLSK
jgi:hypothetical protein